MTDNNFSHTYQEGSFLSRLGETEMLVQFRKWLDKLNWKKKKQNGC